jgi:hypothetical protein
MRLVRVLTVLSGVSFLIYGVLCLSTPSMVYDFHRFGLDKWKTPTGVLEVLGGTGLLVGLRWTPALRLASAGLTLLMLIAFAVRVHARDGVAVSLPSLLLMFVNLYIFIKSLGRPVTLS